VGGRVISPTLFVATAPDQLIFGFDGIGQAQQLVITVNTVPEPGTLVLLMKPCHVKFEGGLR
jgi:hypothetical protein